MPTKRAILAELTPAELRTNLDLYGLSVDDRRVRTQLVDALARSRKVRLDEMLLRLPRNRLKELCRVFSLDDSGRKKANLVARLVGPAAASSASESAMVVSGGDRGIAPPAASRPAAEVSEPPADVLSVAQLEQYLWSAADILRGSIDSSDYKTYIFGLLFLKRLSDRFEEEAEKLIAEGVPEDVAWTDADEHQFFVPDRARWSAIQKRATNIGDAKLRGGWLHVPAPSGPRQTARIRESIVAWFRRHAAERLPERVAAWRSKAGVPMPRVIVSNQQKRWGSCDRNGTIRLNWRIIQAPMRLVDYVVVHELIHLCHRGHGREYWQAVGRVMPDYERRREDLRQCGAGLAW